MVFEIIGRVGACKVMLRRYASNRTRMGCSIRLCAAMSIATRCVSTPALARSAASASNAASGPDTTHKPGAFTDARSRSPVKYGRRSASASGTDSMPPGSIVSNRTPRRCTRPMQSSNPITPARQAAVFSPIEWPTSADGTTPQLWNNCASAYSVIIISGNCTDGRFSRAFAAAASPGAGSHNARMS